MLLIQGQGVNTNWYRTLNKWFQTNFFFKYGGRSGGFKNELHKIIKRPNHLWTYRNSTMCCDFV